MLERFRLPIDSPLPATRGRKAAVLVMLVLGGIVALLVPVFFAVVLLGILRGG